MKIEIDTKHDSHEEIKKVIKMLQHLVGENSVTSQLEPSSGFTNIFADDSSSSGSSGPSEPIQPSQQSQQGIFNLFDDDSENQPEQQTQEEQDDSSTEERTRIEIVPYYR
jgi:hypothetical protein